MYRASSSARARQQEIEDRALEQIKSLTRSSRARTANTNTQRAEKMYSSSKGSFLGDNIATASFVNSKERRQFREDRKKDNELDSINEEGVRQYLEKEQERLQQERRRNLDIAAKNLIQKHKERQPVTTEEDFNQIQGIQGSKTGHRNRLRQAMLLDNSDLEGGYAKLTKVGLLARIMNIKKKAKAAKPTVRKAAKPVKKPVARKPIKPTARKAAKPVKPVRRKPTIVRRK